MIIGFLGKGGSGKSSVSSQMALFLNSQNKHVLAIDADHNIDLSYNLSAGSIPEMNYLGDSFSDFRAAVGLDKNTKYSEVFLSEIKTKFTLSPLSPEIEKYSTQLPNGIRLMAAGPQTDNVMYGKSCSHVLTTPLKIMLPLLDLQANEVTIVDEKAGADGVTTGIVTGVDVGVIVCEPSLHSCKAAKQIAELMDFYGTPHIFIGNKITSSEDKDFIYDQLETEPVTFLMTSNSIKRDPSKAVDEWQDEMQIIFKKAQEINQNNRLERTIEKFKRNKNFT